MAKINSKYLTYYIHYRNENSKEFLAYKNDPELTRNEKNLFRARELMRSKKWDDAIDLLESINEEDHFILAESKFLIMSCFLLKSQYEHAIICGIEALEKYKAIEHREGSFKTSYNISVAYNRVGFNTLSKHYLDIASTNKESKEDQFILSRAYACEYSRQCKFDKALSILKDIFEETEPKFKHEINHFKIVAFDIYFRAQAYDEAYELINEVILQKNTNERGRALFYYHLFEFWKNDKQLPTIPEVIRAIPEFSLQWNILVNVISGDIIYTEALWRQLTTQFPQYYSHNFNCIDESEKKALFYQCILKVIKKDEEIDIDLDSIKSKNSKVLIQTLLESKTPLRKEDLIEIIWKTSYEPKFDTRFYKLIQRTKKDYSINITNNLNAYSID
tara:strand:- start:37638 stop:38807 length:1170 start_codon:yes stop_codon:yes gene_type:complete